MPLIKPAEPAPYQLAKDRLVALPPVVELEAGAGVGRFAEVSGKGKARISGVARIEGPATYEPDDDYTGIALMDRHGIGYATKDLILGGLHVAYRGCDGRRQGICVSGGKVDGAYIGRRELWQFGILARIAGQVIVNGTQFVRGGSSRYPMGGEGGKNQSHRLYLGTSTSLAIDGAEFTDNLAGRDVQVYGDTPDPDTGKIAKPKYWHIRNSLFAKHELDGYVSIQTNPYVLCELENVTVRNDYEAIWAYGDVTMRGGAIVGKGTGLRAMADGITITLEDVKTSGLTKLVEKGGFKNVKVVRV